MRRVKVFCALCLMLGLLSATSFAQDDKKKPVKVPPVPTKYPLVPDPKTAPPPPDPKTAPPPPTKMPPLPTKVPPVPDPKTAPPAPDPKKK